MVTTSDSGRSFNFYLHIGCFTYSWLWSVKFTVLGAIFIFDCKASMFSALKKLAKGGDDRCPAPTPMSSSLQKKFSRGVHYNMKVLIKGDRNVGKSCLLQRLQGGPFIEEYVPTEQIQVAPIHWTYKNTDHIVKVEVWEVVDKGRAKKKPPLGLKLENQSTPANEEDATDTPVLDATFLDVYKNASGVILMLDITKPWTFEYVVKELSRVPADLPVVILGNHCDMQHHRQVHLHHIDQALHQAKLTRTAPVRYAESSMRNGFGLRLLHKFLSVPFLRLQRISLLEQLQRNQKESEEIERELDDFQNSEESHYTSFVDRLSNKRRQSSENTEPRPGVDRSPSIVLGAGKPIIPHNVNPLLAQSLNPLGLKALYGPKAQYSPVELPHLRQTQYVSAELLAPKQQYTADNASIHDKQDITSGPPLHAATPPAGSAGTLDEFNAGALDNSFLDDLAPALTITQQEHNYDTDSDDANQANPMVLNEQDDLDVEFNSMPSQKPSKSIKPDLEVIPTSTARDDNLSSTFGNLRLSKERIDVESIQVEDSLDIGGYPLWAGDSSVRRSPEGGEDPDISSEATEKKEKKHKKKKSKDKDKGDNSDKTERKERKHKHKKYKEKHETHPQQELLTPSSPTGYVYRQDDFDSI